MRILLPILIFLFTFSVFSQSDLPEIGKLSDIQGRTKFYLVASGQSRKAILKNFEKQKVFTIVDKPDDAEFFIEYKITSLTPDFHGLALNETGQMEVYFYRNKKKVIVWSESTEGEAQANDLIKQLLKPYKKK